MIYSIKSLTIAKGEDKHYASAYIKMIDHLLNNANGISAVNVFFETKLQAIAITRVAIFSANTKFKTFRDNTAEGDGTTVI